MDLGLPNGLDDVGFKSFEKFRVRCGGEGKSADRKSAESGPKESKSKDAKSGDAKAGGAASSAPSSKKTDK